MRCRQEPGFEQDLCAARQGFSLHAAPRCKADDRQAHLRSVKFRHFPIPGKSLRRRNERRLAPCQQGTSDPFLFLQGQYRHIRLIMGLRLPQGEERDRPVWPDTGRSLARTQRYLLDGWGIPSPPAFEDATYW